MEADADVTCIERSKERIKNFEIERDCKAKLENEYIERRSRDLISVSLISKIVSYLLKTSELRVSNITR